MRDFHDKVAVITGAASGMGRELALELARRGARLSLCDYDPAGLEETAESARAIGAEVHVKVVNVGEREQILAYADEVVEHYGVVNLLFNNAGVAHHAPVEQTSFKEYDRVMDIDFWGVVNGTKAFLPHLIASGDAHIVNTSSIFGLFAVGGQSAYNAAKFAVRGFTEALRIEMLSSDHAVGVSCVHPGGIKTAICRNATVAEGQNQAAFAAFFDQHLARTEADAAARTILDGVRHNRGKILIGADARVSDALVRLTGSVYQRFNALVDGQLGRFL
ncbi:Short-chain dehydrogenase/reductase SDR OS=Tsukamurella paurometabola (strain ATCC 8368 / DSM/ CCUG 35730 / CIP 100753 / JCM 10117 / KCTC 9821 / NBRC 16120/ NCIMB 702349 / NCTC 13040) OX=521096 GN=Tpau_2257 PE=3 SV=1 [Tsukamurella paurometabola]|uniref:Short-chain dehydrogenase/reductase SDR n=1 Tax=Tsukamurella paurometabola (strain ATCC 8368 / DSM 20162 / CCUG 35730 / CIP 100753 / JCM 10117 / KCTC 9821 / NBRC 16120 / NCIMB 702349 / NCTC 13040) TaxID=521096 RepID=D5UQ96_TSUPD|nr:SDR family oxidoreductase [Tsukamurella paurometabola]ADG78866.1 short-chain dehydrogenase/reductase SDR [Tsukamurella paurometabola DSM 20162]SUP33368.1 Levodione reductase [Tsukamurella paurometabola]